MSPTDELRTAALGLSVEERAKLARELLHSLDGEPDVDASDAWTAELERRISELKRGTVKPLSLDEVRALVARRRAAASRS